MGELIVFSKENQLERQCFAYRNGKLITTDIEHISSSKHRIISDQKEILIESSNIDLSKTGEISKLIQFGRPVPYSSFPCTPKSVPNKLNISKLSVLDVGNYLKYLEERILQLSTKLVVDAEVSQYIRHNIYSADQLKFAEQQDSYYKISITISLQNIALVRESFSLRDTESVGLIDEIVNGLSYRLMSSTNGGLSKSPKTLVFGFKSVAKLFTYLSTLITASSIYNSSFNEHLENRKFALNEKITLLDKPSGASNYVPMVSDYGELVTDKALIRDGKLVAFLTDFSSSFIYNVPSTQSNNNSPYALSLKNGTMSKEQLFVDEFIYIDDFSLGNHTGLKSGDINVKTSHAFFHVDGKVEYKLNPISFKINVFELLANTIELSFETSNLCNYPLLKINIG